MRISAGGSSGLAGAIFFVIAIVVRVTLRHAGPDGSELVRAMEELVERYKTVVKVTETTSLMLSDIQDAETALAATSELPKAFAECRQEMEDVLSESFALDAMIEEDDRTSAANLRKFEKLTESMEGLVTRMQSHLEQMNIEIERIGDMPDLPAEFWDVMRVELCRYVTFAFETKAMIGEEGDDADLLVAEQFSELTDLLEEYGSRKVVTVSLTDISDKEFKAVCQELGDVAEDDAEISEWYDPELEEGFAIIAPTGGFQVYVDKLPAGVVDIQDEGRRTISLLVSAMPEKRQVVEVEEPALVEVEVEGERFGGVEVATAPVVAATEFETGIAGESEIAAEPQITPEPVIVAEPKIEVPKPPEEQQQPEESVQEYYGRLAVLMVGEEQQLSNKAIEKLLALESDEISDKKTRSLIARNFRQLALDGENRQLQGQAIEGLGNFGGKFCVPILLKMLEDGQVQANEEFYEALARFPNAEAADVLVKKLIESRRDDKVVECLRRMGAEAEISLIRARSEDKALTTTFVELLGDVGTEKSFALLRKHTKSKDKKLSELAKESTLKIRKRILAEKETAKDS